MKLELKHLTPYLPYGLKIYEPVQELNLRLDLSTSYNTKNIGLPFLFLYGGYRIEYGLPILRPLSDLTKENNDLYEMIEEYASEDLRWILVNDIGKVSYSAFELLIKHHYDVFGLIDKGLAININEL